MAKQSDPPKRIEELRPEVWWSWRASVEATNRWPSVIQLMAGLLGNTPGVAESTRKALRARHRKPKTRLYDAYSREEFQRIRSASSLIVRTGLRRINANLSTLDTYYSGGEPTDAPAVSIRGRKWTAGEFLDHLARTGCVPPRSANGALSTRVRALVNLDGATTINEALFPNSAETLSLSFLLVCERGYNCSVLDNLTIDVDRADDHLDEDPIRVLHLDKPRRGPAARFSDETLTGDSSRVIGQALEMTDQARKTLALLGNPTESLLIFRTSNAGGDSGAEKFRTKLPNAYHFICRWQDRTSLLADDGTPLQVSHQRLRLTEQVLNTRPRQNSPAVSESIYRRSDPQTRKEAAAVIIRGQTEAIEHARVTVAMRTLTEHDIEAAQADPGPLAERLRVPPEKISLLISGALNTATGACLDFAHSPFADRADRTCRASFLMCLGCSNAVATPAHLPRLVALGDALERIGSAVSSAVWDEDYASHHRRLIDLLTSNTTPQEREQARQQVTDADEAAVMRLLSRGLDA
ncbi:MAG: hypothetical protein ACRDTS_06575 [Mycobacterium sp.]